MAKRTPKPPQRARMSPAAAKVLPYPDFPLSPHLATGRWYKVLAGKRRYFGPLDDWEGALERYERERDYWQRGMKPPSEGGEGVTVRHALNAFLTAKEDALSAGELRPKSFADYVRMGERVRDHFGAGRQLSTLAPEEFGSLRAKWAEAGLGAYALTGEITRVRVWLRWCYESGLVDREIRVGPDFKRPQAKMLRRARNEKRRTMTRDEILAAIDHATPTMQAMILLGINAALGNTDVAELRLRNIDLERGVLDFPRVKSEVGRRAPLWPETIKLLEFVLARRRTPKDEADADRVFITQRGHPWVRVDQRWIDDPKAPGGRRLRTTNIDSVRLEFNKALAGAGIKRSGLSFYQLRRTFETIAGETGDQAAVDRVMGHEAPTMASHYRQWHADTREDERLRRVTDHVRAWLFGEGEG